MYLLIKDAYADHIRTASRFISGHSAGVDSDLSTLYLQYLGFLFNGNNIYLRTGSITKYDHKMKKALFVASKTREKINHKIRTKYNIPHDNRLYKKKLYRKFSSLGKLNFIKSKTPLEQTMLDFVKDIKN